MDAVSISTPSYATQIISNATQKQSVVLIQLLSAVKSAEIAQGKPLANIGEVHQIDIYA